MTHQESWTRAVDKLLPILKQAHEYQLQAGYPSDLEELKAIVRHIFTTALEAKAVEVESLKKEHLDNTDPDNYEACYAIGGFNDALAKSAALIRKPY